MLDSSKERHVACSTSTTNTGSDGGASGSGRDRGERADAAAGDAAAGDAKPEALVIVSLKETNGSGEGLTVTWKAGATGLTAVELWRNADGGAYAKVLSGEGAATSAFDTTATGMKTYCCKLKALRGTAESALAAEECLMTGM